MKFTSFTEEYELKEILGHGKTSTCYRCIHKQTHLEYAVKIIQDAHLHDPSDEIELLFCYRQLTHIIHVGSNENKGRMRCIVFIHLDSRCFL